MDRGNRNDNMERQRRQRIADKREQTSRHNSWDAAYTHAHGVYIQRLVYSVKRRDKNQRKHSYSVK
jgi:hypothetical protein